MLKELKLKLHEIAKERKVPGGGVRFTDASEFQRLIERVSKYTVALPLQEAKDLMNIQLPRDQLETIAIKDIVKWFSDWREEHSDAKMMNVVVSSEISWQAITCSFSSYLNSCLDRWNAFAEKINWIKYRKEEWIKLHPGFNNAMSRPSRECQVSGKVKINPTLEATSHAYLEVNVQCKDKNEEEDEINQHDLLMGMKTGFSITCLVPSSATGKKPSRGMNDNNHVEHSEGVGKDGLSHPNIPE